MKSWVFDTGAFVEFAEGRRHADQVRQIIQKSRAASETIYMSVVNWGELYYTIWRHHGRDVAEEKLFQISQIPVVVIPADVSQAKIAAGFHVRFGLPYADCFAAALSVEKKARLLTSDSDFRSVKSQVVLKLLS